MRVTDVTNTPATESRWKDIFIELIQSDPDVLAKRQLCLDLDPSGIVLVSTDTRALLNFLKVKREKGLVLPGRPALPFLPQSLYEGLLAAARP
jgi:hypothetical protein